MILSNSTIAHCNMRTAEYILAVCLDQSTVLAIRPVTFCDDAQCVIGTDSLLLADKFRTIPAKVKSCRLVVSTHIKLLDNRIRSSQTACAFTPLDRTGDQLIFLSPAIGQLFVCSRTLICFVDDMVRVRPTIFDCAFIRIRPSTRCKLHQLF